MIKKLKYVKVGKLLHEALAEARALIEDPAHWTTSTVARDRKGLHVEAYADGAVCWCAIGALMHGRGNADVPENWLHVLDFAAECSVADIESLDEILDLRPTSYVNDFQGHAAVLDMYDRALAIPIGQKIPIPE